MDSAVSSWTMQSNVMTTVTSCLEKNPLESQGEDARITAAGSYANLTMLEGPLKTPTWFARARSGTWKSMTPSVRFDVQEKEKPVKDTGVSPRLRPASQCPSSTCSRRTGTEVRTQELGSRMHPAAFTSPSRLEGASGTTAVCPP